MIKSNKILFVTKNILLAGSLSLLLLGCSDKEEKKEQKVQAPKVQSSTTGKIEVTQSKETFEKKVEEKETISRLWSNARPKLTYISDTVKERMQKDLK